MNEKRKSIYIYWILSLLFATGGWAQIQPVKNGPIHEALMTNNGGQVVLQAISQRPPHPIIEDLPPQIDSQAEWIHGYWVWMKDTQSFIWVTGVERRAPPGHFWSHGYWKYYNEGWTWIPGFWTQKQYHQLNFIETPPPDPVDENPGQPPDQKSFWMQGYWNYDAAQNEYEWVKGKWEPFDSNWVYVPAHYMWQPDGFIFFPAYWDWPIHVLGQLYSPVKFLEQEIPRVYHPSYPLKMEEMIRRSFLYYPDFLNYFNQHYHTQSDFWRLFLHTPPWWPWSLWWGFTWKNQWALWWWFTHPGYPQPSWITQEVSGMLPNPWHGFFKESKRIVQPYIITPNGVVSPSRFIAAIRVMSQRGREFTERLRPILPADEQLLQETISLILPPQIPKEQILKPAGSFATLKIISPTLILQPFELLSAQTKDKKIKMAAEAVATPKKPTIAQQIKMHDKDAPLKERTILRPFKLQKPTIEPKLDVYPLLFPSNPTFPQRKIIPPFTPYKSRTEEENHAR